MPKPGPHIHTHRQTDRNSAKRLPPPSDSSNFISSARSSHSTSPQLCSPNIFWFLVLMTNDHVEMFQLLHWETGGCLSFAFDAFSSCAPIACQAVKAENVGQREGRESICRVKKVFALSLFVFSFHAPFWTLLRVWSYFTVSRPVLWVLQEYWCVFVCVGGGWLMELPR